MKMVIVFDTGGTNAGLTNVNYGLRPVINLKAGTKFKIGTDGTWQHPYIVVGTND